MTMMETHKPFLAEQQFYFKHESFTNESTILSTQSVMAISLMGIPIGSGWYSNEFDLIYS